MEAYYFAFGPFDVVAVIDLPGDEAAAAASLTVNSTGAVHVEVTKLLIAEQVDAALAMTPDYRPPGSS
jgi:uncharacterized protein with GYD domain